MKLRIKSETLRDWRVLLLILVDLMAILAIFPRVTRSTTVFSITDLNSAELLRTVLEEGYDDVELIFLAQENGLWLHGFKYRLPAAREHESALSDLRSRLSGMIPRGIPPTISITNLTLVYANITASDRDVFVHYLETKLDTKVTSIQTLRNTTSMVMNTRESREDLLDALGASATITEFDNPRTLKTNLKLGIDFLGGFYYNVRPVGVTFRAEISAGNVTPILVQDFINTSAVLKEKGERGILTVEFETPFLNNTPSNMTDIVVEAIVDNFFDHYPTFERISFTYGDEKSQIVMNVTNYDALRAVLNSTLSLRYDPVGGSEAAGIFDVEGRGSEATVEELRANLSRYLVISDYETKVSKETMTEVEKMIESRANFIGLADLRIKRAADEYIMVESPERIASGSSVLEPLDFEARLWISERETIPVFTSVDVARVDHFFYVHDAGGWAVPLTLTRDAAREMQVAAQLYGAIDEDPDVRDEHRLGMFFNGIEVYNASFSESLAEQMRTTPVTSILAITGGPRENDEARKRAEELWINLEASFPTKLRTAGEGQIPPTLGKDFAQQVAAAAVAALAGVSIVIYLRYRRPKLVMAILAVSLSEALIILGFAVMIGWYLDLASVAGIIAVIGTGVDHQIVITDEAFYEGEGKKRLVISTRISRAFFIIFTAAATTIIAMSPLAYVGLGRLRGFAIVTIIGVLSGVIITRPAYGRIVRRIVGGR